MSTVKKTEAIRSRILESAAAEIFRHGFKAASLSRILQASGASKGALYHHFVNKQSLGQAVLDEVFTCEFRNVWAFDVDRDRPVQAFCEFLVSLPTRLDEMILKRGCPVCNITMEMSVDDPKMRDRVQQLFSWLQGRIQAVLDQARQNGQLRQGVNTEASASFLVAAIQGVEMQVKYQDNPEKIGEILQAMIQFMQSQLEAGQLSG